MADRQQVNFILDALMFLVLSLMAGIGFLMHFVLLTGRERWLKYGRNVDLRLFGWDRHDWGALHYYLALTFLVLLATHIVLHWHLLPRLFARAVPHARTRKVVLWVFLFLALIFLYFPFLFTPEVRG